MIPWAWPNGYLVPNLTQADVIGRLLMNGKSSFFARIPNGRIYGLGYTWEQSGKRWHQNWGFDLWEVGLGDVQRNPRHL